MAREFTTTGSKKIKTLSEVRETKGTGQISFSGRKK